ncbi:ABC transporter substrate-binding protein [Xylanibacillus composti]|uniref:ABC transporter substrate-binding protein n=1 Tax=Xylanibacillus composti TaxID=1572762 RepID=A0A8J4M298_9BACL|nr:ABC transporter substrate-binding protein [Xylanibacillus composti]MDT9724077.1 ABC transporter substrate-binding protein [Xylanibacillus composti]GIQ69469.1 ABC transporter substrate-binding protein [Xylanibacillus composti]
MKLKVTGQNRGFSILVLVAACLLLLSACSSGGNGSNGAATSSQQSVANDATSGGSANEGAQSSEPVDIIWWHAMGGEMGRAVDDLVEQFNSSQEGVRVEAVFQGSYDELLNKMKASFGSNAVPAMVQMNEVSSRYMIDSGEIEPVQTFIDQEGYDLDKLEPNITGYYTFDGQLYAMPFNTSNPLLYYNKDMFAAAGLDPESPPQTFEEVYEAAKTLTKDSQTGIAIAISPWFTEQLFANQGALLVNNGNGREAPATESLLASEAGMKIMTWWKQMIDEKVALNLGRKTADTKKAFVAGQVGMIIDSTAGLKGIVDSVGNQFEVGTGFLPRPADGAPGGVVVGGGSLYILKDATAEQQQAAWEFMKFLAEPEQQAYWHIQTGYFPVTPLAYELDSVQQNMAEFPQFQTAVDQLHATTLNPATQGAVMGVFADARESVANAIEQVLTGAMEPEEALQKAAEEIQAQLERYNMTNG